MSSLIRAWCSTLAVLIALVWLVACEGTRTRGDALITASRGTADPVLASALAVFYTGNGDGEIEPCG